MSIREVSKGHLAHKLGDARVARMPEYIRNLVFNGHSTLEVDGIAYRACSDAHLALAHKAAPRIAAQLAPEPEKRRDLVAEYRAELAAERALEPRDEPTSPRVRAMLAAEREAKPVIGKRVMPETAQDRRIRNQQMDDARRAALAGKRPPKMCSLFEGDDEPKGAA